jgi:hypothetical protein
MNVFRQTDRKKHPTPVVVRPLTVDEIRAIPTGSRVPIILNNGRLGECTITSFKTWKREPQRIEIGTKYGMYEFAKFDLAQAQQRFVREVE